MGLRRKTQIIIGLVLLGVMSVLYAVTRRTLMVQFSRLEEQEQRQNIDRVSNAIENELDLLNGSARDDSQWDEAYEFVSHPHQGWGENAFNEDSYSHLRLNTLVYLNADGNPVYAREFDDQTVRQKDPSPGSLSAFVAVAKSVMPFPRLEGTGGIADMPSGPFLVAIWPVLTSAGRGPAHGTLIMARRLDTAELHRLGWTKGLQFDIFCNRTAAQFPQSLQSTLPALSPGDPPVIASLNEDQIAGYTMLKGLPGSSCVLLRLIAPRHLHQQARKTLSYLMYATLLTGLGFTLAYVYLLDRLILSRLIRLNDAVSSISASSDLVRRVPADGNDELGHLGISINRMLAALAHSQQDLHTQAQAIEASGDGIAILNARGEFLYLNQAHAAIFGHGSAGDLVGQSWKALYAPEEAARIEQHIMPLLFRDKRWEGEAAAQRRDGSIFPQQLSLAVLAQGGMVCVCRDLTERRKLEDQLHKKQRMEAIGTLAGGIAHDFNNLLTVILGHAQTLFTKVENDPGLRANVEHIVKSAGRAGALTRQLLAFSRKQVLQPRVLDLNVVVHDMEKMLRPLVGDDIVMLTECASGLGCVKADLSQIEQVIVNLVVNARDAMPRGGRLVVSTANIDRNFPTALGDRDVPPGRYVLLSVADNGTGMSPEVLGRIFEPFYTTKGVGQGTGLGLSTVYGIVEQSGGYISVESRSGTGTTFHVFLPRVNAQPDNTAPERSPIRRTTGDETILLVEDDAAVRELAQEILRSAGYRVLPVADPRSLDVVSRQHPETIHLLLTDVLMPGINGREVAERVRRSQPQTRVLFMSGYAFHTMLDRGVLEPGSFFIQKPFTPSQLVEKVREVLDSVQARTTVAR